MHTFLQRAFETGNATRRLKAGAVLAASLLVMAVPVQAQVSGRASATGSDSLSLNGQNFQLFGIEGLAFNQSCFVDGQPFACGASATRALQTLLDPAAVSCEPKGVSASGATLAACTGHDGDVAQKMVELGWAFADPAVPDAAYAAAEAAARDGRAGAWRGTFLMPPAYRAQIAAIEARYAARAGTAAQIEAEAAIVAGAIDLRGLSEVALEPVEAGASAPPLEVYEVHFGAFRPGFISAAIEPPAVFDWQAVAGVLDGTRREGVAEVEAGVAEAIWDELAARPAQTIDTRNADGFYAALKSRSAAWLAAGRQPILYVMAPDLPNWVRGWFAGQAPVGAEVSRREDRADPAYLGTIDGVDVYIGPGRQRAALLVPSDILSAVSYRTDADGRVLALSVDAATNAWVVRYGMALRWGDDMLTWLAFPQMASPTPDAM